MVWLYVNQAIDTDEKLEGMCPICRQEVISSHKCSRCGKTLHHDGDDTGESYVNPNFDKDRFNKLSGDKVDHEDEDIVEVVE